VWLKYPGLREQLNLQSARDGVWWMTFQDWFANFSKVYICVLFNDLQWRCYQLDGMWHQGVDTSLSVIEEQKNSEAHMKPNSNKQWFKND
jgi:hypothetical protein